MKGTCGLVAGAALTSCGIEQFGSLDLVPGDTAVSLVADRMVVSSCEQCPGGCGIEVRVAGREAVSIRGLPSHPVNRGRLCPRGVAGLQMLYHPRRLKGPMRCAGPRGSGRFEPISWEEALEDLAGRLLRLREAGKSHSVALLTGGQSGQMTGLFERFARAYGTPNFSPATLSGEGASAQHLLTQGLRDHPAFDWERARYVLSFGSNWLEAWDPPEILQRAFAFLRRGTPGTRVKIVEVSPRYTLTAAKADEWVPARPGTSGALALALAHVLVAEDGVDEEFLSEHTQGYEDWTDRDGTTHPGFKRIVLENYPPKWAEAITGISSDRIRRLARELVKNRPAVVLGEVGPPAYTNSASTGVAVHSLNALLGAINRPGGVLVQREPPYADLSAIEADETAKRGSAMARADGAGTEFPLAERADGMLPRAILAEKPYPIEALLLHRTNPLHTHPASCGWRAALAHVPFVVSFNSFLDQSSSYADLVLPDHTYLERLEDKPVAPSTGFAVVSLRSPVVPPLYDTRHTGDVLLDLAARLGGTVAASFPWKDFRSLLSDAVAGLAGRGTLQGVAPETALSTMQAAGYWSDAGPVTSSWEDAVRTFTGEFVFAGTGPIVVGENGPERGAQAGKLGALGLPEGGDRALLSCYEEPCFAGDAKTYPFHLLTHEIPTLDESAGAAQPLLREIGSGFFDERWERHIEVHPETARSLGLRDGDQVRVVSPAGRTIIRLRTFVGLPENSVALPVGGGGQADANLLIENIVESLSGSTATSGTRVRLEKVT